MIMAKKVEKVAKGPKVTCAGCGITGYVVANTLKPLTSTTKTTTTLSADKPEEDIV